MKCTRIIFSAFALILCLAMASCKKQECCQNGGCWTVSQDQFPGGKSEYQYHVKQLEENGATCTPK